MSFFYCILHIEVVTMEKSIINIKPKFYGNTFYLTIEGLNDLEKQNPFKGRENGFYRKILIKNNPNAKCDISGETDKRFLVLHHLHNRSDGGENTEDNYVILTNNYHLAFHSWNKGYANNCTRETYEIFKKEELERIGKKENGS